MNFREMLGNDKPWAKSNQLDFGVICSPLWKSNNILVCIAVDHMKMLVVCNPTYALNAAEFLRIAASQSALGWA